MPFIISWCLVATSEELHHPVMVQNVLDGRDGADKAGWGVWSMWTLTGSYPWLLCSYLMARPRHIKDIKQGNERGLHVFTCVCVCRPEVDAS